MEISRGDRINFSANKVGEIAVDIYINEVDISLWSGGVACKRSRIKFLIGDLYEVCSLKS